MDRPQILSLLTEAAREPMPTLESFDDSHWEILERFVNLVQSQGPISLPFDAGYVHAYLKAALLMVEPNGLTDPQAAYFLEWLETISEQAPMTQAARDVLAERQRQIEKEGWTPEHDDQLHGLGELAAA